MRGASAGSEPIDLERVRAVWPEDVPILEDGDARRELGAGYVHLAACGPDQRAQEFDLPECMHFRRRTGRH